MSFIAKLQLQNEDELSVLKCSYRFYQNLDPGGRVATLPLGGIITLTLVSSSNPGLFEWMIERHQKKNGIITFIRYDTMSKLKTLEFMDTLCVEYHETFDPAAEHPMVLQLVLNAHVIKMEGLVFKKHWAPC